MVSQERWILVRAVTRQLYRRTPAGGRAAAASGGARESCRQGPVRQRARSLFQPRRHRQAFGAQELWIKQPRLIPQPRVGQDRGDCMAAPELRASRAGTTRLTPEVVLRFRTLARLRPVSRSRATANRMLDSPLGRVNGRRGEQRAHFGAPGPGPPCAEAPRSSLGGDVSVTGTVQCAPRSGQHFRV